MHASDIRAEMQNRAFSQALGMVPDEYRDKIVDQASQGQLVYKRDPYYSKGRIQWSTSKNMSTTTFTLSTGFQAVLFGYGLNDSMTGAGFIASTGYDRATLADTNLFKGGETNAAELQLITGIGFALCGDVDPLLCKRTLHQVYLSGGVNGNTNDFKWGIPTFWPSGSGLYGMANSLATIPGTNDTIAQQGAFTNGVPGAEDFSKDIDPVLWGPKGQADSTFQAVLTVQRTMTFTLVDRTTGGGPPAVNTAFTAPAQPNTTPINGEGSYIDFYIRLFGAQFAPRGRNR